MKHHRTITEPSLSHLWRQFLRKSPHGNLERPYPPFPHDPVPITPPSPQHHDTTASAVEELKRRGFSIFVADLMDGSHSPDTLPLEGPVAILMGAELTGVSDEARALADGAICVPMRGVTESLNVSVAAACIVQRVTERRREQVGGGDLPVERKDQFFEEWVQREIESRRGIVLRSTPSSATDH